MCTALLVYRKKNTLGNEGIWLYKATRCDLRLFLALHALGPLGTSSHGILEGLAQFLIFDGRHLALNLAAFGLTEIGVRSRRRSVTAGAGAPGSRGV